MNRLVPLIRISLGLVVVTCSLLLGMDLFGVIPAPGDRIAESRIRLCEILAAQAATSAERNDLASVRAAFQIAVQRNEEVLSAGLRRADGMLLVASRDHRELWGPQTAARSKSTHVRLPLFKGGEDWAVLEVRFAEAGPRGLLGALWQRPLIRLVLLVAVTGFVAYLLYMRRTLRHLDPSAVIPTRVQAALDVMTEGVLLLDPNERIVLANAAFAERVGQSPGSLLGVKPSSLDWRTPDSGERPRTLPWVEAIRESTTSEGALLVLAGSDSERTFIAKGAPVLDGWGRAKGAIATFDDVTELERKTAELERARGELEKSRDEVRLQNEELAVLARSDPLTGIANRRAFMETSGNLFAEAKRQGRAVSCVMLDLDHFKRVNDSHGHAAGDEVLRRVAGALAEAARSTDAACRYGGEEFCVVLADTNAEDCALLAERLRRRIESPGFARVPVTASLGVSSAPFGAGSLEELINQADEALYASKRAGRNRVTRWDQR